MTLGTVKGLRSRKNLRSRFGTVQRTSRTGPHGWTRRTVLTSERVSDSNLHIITRRTSRNGDNFFKDLKDVLRSLRDLSPFRLFLLVIMWRLECKVYGNTKNIYI